MGVSKIIADGNTLIDLTGDSVTSEALAEGYSAHGANGEQLYGIMPVVSKEEIVREVLESIGTPIFGIVDSDNEVVLTGQLADGTYSIKYEMENGNTVNIGNLVLDTKTYYFVTKTLTYCTINNSATKVAQGESYSATITANSGYTLKSVSVTMGGSAVTVTNGVINIASVTGNIVITAVAEVVQTGPTNLADPTSSDWATNYRLSTTSGGLTACDGHIVTNFIPATVNDVLRVKGLNITSIVNTKECCIVSYKANKTKQSNVYTGQSSSSSPTAYAKKKVSVNGDISTYTIMENEANENRATTDTAYIRIDGALLDGYTANDVIITINEEIT